MATGITLATKGMISPLAGDIIIQGGGGGGAGLRKEDDIGFPKIIVNKFKIDKHEDKSLTEGSLKVTSVKLIID